jgi:hypothetical protein
MMEANQKMDLNANQNKQKQENSETGNEAIQKCSEFTRHEILRCTSLQPKPHIGSWQTIEREQGEDQPASKWRRLLNIHPNATRGVPEGHQRSGGRWSGEAQLLSGLCSILVQGLFRTLRDLFLWWL